MDVLLLNSGYFRLVGSHNDRMPLSLCYLSAFLEEAGLTHCVYNSEYTGARTYWSWLRLCRSFELLRLAVAGQSPVFREVAEAVADYDPEVVILGCGDPLLASVGLGNPHAAVQQARVLREAGVRTIYFFGPYATLDSERWLAEGVFAGVLVGPPSRRVVDVVRNRPPGRIFMGEMPLDRAPNLDRLEPAGQRRDIVLASIGCAWRCRFCLSPRILPAFQHIDPALVAEDLARRPSGRVYFGDMVFGAHQERLVALAEACARRDLRGPFVCETRADVLDDRRCRTLREMGVVAVKVGVESIDPQHLGAMHKQLTTDGLARGLACLRRHDLKVILYLMLGGPGSSEASTRATFDWASAQHADYVVVSVWSDDDVGRGHAFQYDAHFSPDCLKRWNIDEVWLERYLSLQRDRSVSKLERVIV